ncbi:MAG: hypothetical protein SO116_04965 [Treponema sp.]|nr:hypothetical protein [Spirochaetia bacterium]MDY4902206.1 hypothetical protein [Treponema sp.]
MKKKMLAIFASLFVAGSSSVFAMGVGIQTGAGLGGYGLGNLSATVKLDNVPYLFTADVGFGTYGISLGAAADRWMANPKIGNSMFNWFWGLGAGAGLQFYNYDGDSYLALNAAFRVPVGINCFLGQKKNWEVYVQSVPQVGLAILPDIGLYWGVPFYLGGRYWF